MNFVQLTAHTSRNRKSEKRHHPIRFDFIKPLQQPAALLLAEIVVDDEKAHEAVRPHAPVAKYLSSAKHITADENGAVDPLTQRSARRMSAFAGEQLHAASDEATPLELPEPFLRNAVG